VLGINTSNKVMSEKVIKILSRFNVQSKLKKVMLKALAAHLGKQSVEKIRQQFDIVDFNKDGILSASELGTLLERMGVSAEESKNEVTQFITNQGINGSNGIDFDEFVQI